MTARPAGFYRKRDRHLTQGRGTILNPRFDIARSDRSIVTLGRVQQDALAELKGRIASGEMRFESFDCPICGGSDIQPLATRDRYGVPCVTGVCADCGLMQTNPYPDGESLGWFYGTIFARLHRGTETPSDTRFEARRAKAATIVSWLKNHGGPTGGTMIDVGCASGGFLQGMVDHGFAGFGVEIDADYAADARERGLDVRIGTVDTVAEAKQADLVTYMQVLEHIPGLNEEIERLATTLKQGACVFIEVGPTSVPGMYNYDFLRLLQLAHVWHFTPATLTAAMARHGFKCVAIDDFVRGLFRFTGERRQPGEFPTETPADIAAMLRRLEGQRLRHWRTWAIKAKALAKRLTREVRSSPRSRCRSRSACGPQSKADNCARPR